LSHLVICVDVILHLLVKLVFIINIVPCKKGIFEAQTLLDFGNKSLIVDVDEILSSIVLADDFITMCAWKLKGVVLGSLLHVLHDKVWWGIILEGILAQQMYVRLVGACVLSVLGLPVIYDALFALKIDFVIAVYNFEAVLGVAK